MPDVLRVIPQGETAPVTDLDVEMKLGDSKTLQLQLVNDATPPAPINLTSVGIVIKFSIKEYAEDTNAEALVHKRSYDATEAAVVTAASGIIAIYLRKEDSIDDEAGSFPWDVEVTRKGATVPAATVGNVSVVAGTVAIIGVGTAFTKLHVGDLIQLDSLLPENAKLVTVDEVVSDTEIRTDYDAWVTEAGIAIAGAWAGDVKTPVGGTWTFKQDATR